MKNYIHSTKFELKTQKIFYWEKKVILEDILCSGPWSIISPQYMLVLSELRGSTG